MYNKISKFSLLIQADNEWGIDSNNSIPFNLPSWSKYIKDKTVGRGKNAVIMGRGLFDNLRGHDDNFKLDNRSLHVVSTKYKTEDFNGIMVHPTLLHALQAVTRGYELYDDVFVLGGNRMFKIAIEELIYYCKTIYVCFLSDSHQCNIFLNLHKYGLKPIEEERRIERSKILIYRPKIQLEEYKYLKLVREVLDGFLSGSITKDRYLFNKSIGFDVENSFPVLTFRGIDYKKIFKQIDDDFSNMTFYEDSIGFRLCTDESFDKNKQNNEYEESNKLDSLSVILQRNKIITLSLSRGHFDEELPETITFHANKTYLYCKVFYNKLELFIKFPEHLVYLTTLMYIIAKLNYLIPKEIVFCFNYCYIKEDYLSFCNRILDCDPKPPCKLHLVSDSTLSTIKGYGLKNLQVENYNSWVVFKEKELSNFNK